MNDIEDYLYTKSNSSNNNYNNMDDFLIKKNVDNYKKILNNLLEWIYQNKKLANIESNNELYDLFKVEFTNQLRKFKALKPNDCRKSMLLYVLNNYVNSKDFDIQYIEFIDLLKLLLRKKPLRNVSGITSITVLTAPFPDGQTFSCKHNCYYCPNEPAHKGNNWQAQPRSYLFREPAVLRANENKFYAIGQMLSRMDNYYAMGHIIDKLEIIIEGGTFTEYPIPYLERFHRDIFYIANIYFELRSLYPNYETSEDGFDINILKNLREPLSIEQEIKINKTAKVHIIGICIETRPDAINDNWLKLFRKWGITRIQLGAQHVDNRILKKINRGHTIEQLLWAMQYLKDNCFKIDIHIMPDLPGSSPEIDKNMFDYVYSVVCPDQMKVYPCEVVPWTVIEKWYKKGEYVPYFETRPQDLIDVVKYSMETCPNWVRLARVIRDIPCTYIESGNTFSNLRQIIDNKLNSDGIISQEIRSREIGRHSKYYNKPANYNIYSYKANNGLDYFIAYESYDKRAIFGFIRLRILSKNKFKNMLIFENLKNKGLVRELHVYGDTTAVNTYKKRACQHKGIGIGLLKIAEKISLKHGCSGIAVISGEGVKGYYEKNGYKEVDTFMIKDFKLWQHLYINFYKIISMLIIIIAYVLILSYF